MLYHVDINLAINNDTGMSLDKHIVRLTVSPSGLCVSISRQSIALSESVDIIVYIVCHFGACTSKVYVVYVKIN